MAIAWSRPEAFGAWVRLDDATLLAVDPQLAGRLGVAHGTPSRAHGPLEVHLAVTARCPAPCTGCYLDARPDGLEPSLAELRERLRAASAAGASTVAFGGGEPLTRRDLHELASEARSLGLVPVLTTSGIGLTPERARELSGFAQINVSHDGVGAAYEAVRGFDGRAHAERAIALLSSAGIAVGVNLVLTRGSVGALEATAARVVELGAGELQLLRYKPAGRADDPSYEERRLDEAEVATLWPTLERLSASRALRIRIDCAMVPLLSEGLLAASREPGKALAKLGVFGCEAGRHLGAVRVDGSPAACSFFSIESARTSLLHGASATPAKLRAYHADPPEPCRSCPLFSVCRGGCQIVSRRATGGAFAPDPECPSVRKSRA